MKEAAATEAALTLMKGIQQALLVMGSAAGLIIATFATYFAFAYPSIISLLLFVMAVPVSLMLGVGFFRIAQEEFLKSKQAPPKSN
jgi:hypothetical protein